MASKSLETKGWSARELARPCGQATGARSLVAAANAAAAIALPLPYGQFLGGVAEVSERGIKRHFERVC